MRGVLSASTWSREDPVQGNQGGEERGSVQPRKTCRETIHKRDLDPSRALGRTKSPLFIDFFLYRHFIYTSTFNFHMNPATDYYNPHFEEESAEASPWLETCLRSQSRKHLRWDLDPRHGPAVCLGWEGTKPPGKGFSFQIYSLVMRIK